MKLYLTMNGKDYELNISAREETSTQSIAMSDSETENLLKESAKYLMEKAMFNVDHALAMATGKIQHQDLSVASSCLHDLLGDLPYVRIHPLSLENLVYTEVKAARLAHPVNTTELERIKATYGIDLYKKALFKVLTEKMKAKSEE